MDNSGRRSRNILIMYGLVLILACGGLAILQNTRFGPARDFVALNTTSSGSTSDAGSNAATSIPVSPTRSVRSPLDKVDPGKMAPPQNCGVGDRYAVVCKDGTVRKGYSSYGCENHGGLDYYLVCPH